MSVNLIQNLKFDDRGLIPAVVQDDKSNEILMLAYMNSESLQKTLQTGETHFWSRSRNELWHKGATSGNTQRVTDIRIDCDSDALIVRVDPSGPACHTGEQTCFFREINEAAPIAVAPAGVSLVNVDSMELGILLNNLYTLISERKEERPEGSYTTYLFNSGLDKILKKIGEESTETIIAAKNGSKKEMSAEVSDLLYHLLVMMVERDVRLTDILAELQHRVGRAADQKYSEGPK
jgi:phosphoribosyl-ATP pyrophosphohydrolase/phosphoribosyl-AMP cyclohydrolase